MDILKDCNCCNDFEFFRKDMVPRSIADHCPRMSLEEIALLIKSEHSGKAPPSHLVHFATCQPVSQREILEGNFSPEASVYYHHAKLTSTSKANLLLLCVQSLLELFGRHQNVYHTKSETISNSDLHYAHQMVQRDTGREPNAIWYSKHIAAVISLAPSCMISYTAEMYDNSLGSTGVICLQPKTLVVIRT